MVAPPEPARMAVSEQGMSTTDAAMDQGTSNGRTSGTSEDGSLRAGNVYNRCSYGPRHKQWSHLRNQRGWQSPSRECLQQMQLWTKAQAMVAPPEPARMAVSEQGMSTTDAAMDQGTSE